MFLTTNDCFNHESHESNEYVLVINEWLHDAAQIARMRAAIISQIRAASCSNSSVVRIRASRAIRGK